MRDTVKIVVGVILVLVAAFGSVYWLWQDRHTVELYTQIGVSCYSSGNVVYQNDDLMRLRVQQYRGREPVWTITQRDGQELTFTGECLMRTR